MRRFFWGAVLICVSCFVFGCGKPGAGGSFLRENAKVRLKASDVGVESSLTSYARSNGLKTGLDPQTLIAGSPVFLIEASEANGSDIFLIMNAVFEIFSESKAKNSEENGKSIFVKESTTKVRQLTLQSTTKGTKPVNDDEFDDLTVCRTIQLSGKQVYKGVFDMGKKPAPPQESTSLSAQQLLSLLKDNGLEVQAIAYAESKDEKGVLFSIRIIKK